MSLHCDCLHTSEVTGETVVRETDVRQEYKLWVVEFVYSCSYLLLFLCCCFSKAQDFFRCLFDLFIDLKTILH